MRSGFGRTRSALEADSFRISAAGLLFSAALIAAWLVWFFFARVSLYEVSAAARLEADRAAHAVQAPIDGRLLSSRLILGKPVKAGEILAEIESDQQRLERKEQMTRLAALAPQLEAVQSEMAMVEQAGRDERKATAAAIEVARAQVREAEAPARYAEQEAARLRQLRADSLIAERDLLLGESEAQRKRATVDSLNLTLARLETEQRARDSDREARLRQLRGEAARIEGDMNALRASLDRLQYEINRRVIRAPVSGILGEVAMLRKGAVVKEGDKLASIIPDGAIKLMADFPPAAGGRIRAGQPARLRLDGFPWAQYGSIAAVVDRVGNEVRDGLVRVELTVQPEAHSAIPIQHGLPGSVEVEVERVSPAELGLRVAGRLVTLPRQVFASGSQPAAASR